MDLLKVAEQAFAGEKKEFPAFNTKKRNGFNQSSRASFCR